MLQTADNQQEKYFSKILRVFYKTLGTFLNRRHFTIKEKNKKYCKTTTFHLHHSNAVSFRKVIE